MIAANPPCPHRSAKFGHVLSAMEQLLVAWIQGKECAARYLFESWKEAAGQRNAQGILRGADPDVALETFRPGDVATLELGSGERLEVDITAVLPGDEIAFIVRAPRTDR